MSRKPDHTPPQQEQRARETTGAPGLDEILHGGLPNGRPYLLSGYPGSGKTTLGLQFLLEGSRQGQSCLFASLLQTRDELEDITVSHGWDLSDIEFAQVPEQFDGIEESQQTVFSPTEVELGEVVDDVIELINRVKPQRFVLDSLNELQTIIESPYHLRRQLVRIKAALLDLEQPSTAVLIFGEDSLEQQPTTQTIVHGAIRLKCLESCYGAPLRRLEIQKVRGIEFEGGDHDYQIHTGGLTVYPRLKIHDGHPGVGDLVSSGNDDVDQMFGGGLHESSTCLLMGTSGAGKSTLASLYAAAVADAGKPVTVYNFDETRNTYLQRSRGLALGIVDHVENGTIDLRSYNAGELATGAMLHDIRRDVENGTRLVVVDSFTGFENMIPGEPALANKLHEMFSFLNRHRVLTLVTCNLHGLFGPLDPDIDVSYLADTVVLLRHFEALGQVRQCISVLKKRHGDHERTVREMRFESGGIKLGPPLEEFSGVLSGTPQYHGQRKDLLAQQQEQ